MKKLFFFLLFLPTCLWGQGEFSNIQIGASFSPDYNYRMLKSIGEISYFDKMIDDKNNEKIGKFGYTTSINPIYNFSELFGLEIGVQ